MSIPIVTREEMEETRKVFEDARSKYNLVYHNFLETILSEAGVRNKLVEIKGDGLRGQFKVSVEPYLPRPWTIKFFPVRKTYEGISMKSKNIPTFYPWQEDTLVQQLKEICEVVGDLP